MGCSLTLPLPRTRTQEQGAAGGEKPSPRGMEPRAKSCMQDGQTPTSHRRHGQAESWSSSQGSTEGAELLQQHSRGRGVKLRAQSAGATFCVAAINPSCPAATRRSRAGGEDGVVPHCSPHPIALQ